MPNILALTLLLVAWVGSATTYVVLDRGNQGGRNGTSQSSCRCYPGDGCWPSPAEWETLNSTVGGRLIATVPLAAPCHNDDPWATFNNGTCETLRNEWLMPQTHYVTSSSVMAPFFANRSCDPFQDPSYQCVIGTYVQYAINVSNANDVIEGLSFASKYNIRLVIRNTGHDYNGKSTGSGSLGLWMHNLQDIEFIDWNDDYYIGKAIKMGAGVQGFQAYDAANAQGLAVIGGECPSVGLAGGYTQGGGHSALMSRYGLAADQALEWEVVTATGEHLIVNRTSPNKDLYWALSGGGGGTYAVVLSLTSKAHPETPTSAMNLTFTSENITQDQYYEAISTFHASLPAIVDSGAMSVWYFTNQSFAISPITAPGVPVAQLRILLQPLISKLKTLNISHTSYFGQFPTYLAEFSAMFSPIEVGIAQYGGRLIPRSVVEQNNTALTDAYRFINDQGAQFIGVGCNVSMKVAGNVDNAVNPGWRTALIDTVITTPWSFEAPWSEMVARQSLMTDVLIPRLAAMTPNGSCYLNEGNFQQPDFQAVFYGDNYDRLKAIKDKYDPQHMFYAVTAVGSEYWEEAPEDGRLCRSSNNNGDDDQ